MKNKNKKPLVIISLLVLVAIISISVIFYTRETKDKELLKVDKNLSTEKTEFNNEEQDNINKVDDSKNSNVIEEKKDNEQESKTENISIPEKETVTNQNQTKTNESKKDNTQNNTSKKEEIVSKQENPTLPIVEQPKACTPKKFTMSFVRADFSSFYQCQEMGEKYRKGGYRYFCDNYQDDCGDTYYMLSLTKPNSSEELDYHNIPVPEIPKEEIPNE